MFRRSVPWLFLFAFVIVLTLSAGADVNDLAGGVYIAHFVAELPYSTDPPVGGWCRAYESYAIPNSQGQVNRVDIPGGDEAPVSWFVLSAWAEEKVWGLCQFGFGDFDPALFAFSEWSACCPVGFLEIPTAGWPGPNAGTAFTRIGSVGWEASIAPVYWFGGYAYAASAPGMIPLGVDPSYNFAGWVNNVNPPAAFEAECLGALGIDMDGVACHPIPPVAVAVCCVGHDCVLESEAGCLDLGGAWHPEWVSCEPNPCLPLPAAQASWGRIKSIYK